MRIGPLDDGTILVLEIIGKISFKARDNILWLKHTPFYRLDDRACCGIETGVTKRNAIIP